MWYYQSSFCNYNSFCFCIKKGNIEIIWEWKLGYQCRQQYACIIINDIYGPYRRELVVYQIYSTQGTHSTNTIPLLLEIVIISYLLLHKHYFMKHKIYRHVFCPRRCRQRCALWHIMQLYKSTPAFHIYFSAPSQKSIYGCALIIIFHRFRDLDLVETPQVKIYGSGPSSYVIVTPTDRALYGIYKCIATNTLGEAEHIIQFREAFPPGPVVQVSELMQ